MVCNQPSPTVRDLYARPVRLDLDMTGSTLVSPDLFGCNLEHTRANIFTGLSAQMLRNRKFAGKPSTCRGCAAEWFPLEENGIFTFTQAYTRHSEGYHMRRNHECNSLNMFLPRPELTDGIGQHGLHVVAGWRYDFALVARTTGPVTVTVSLTDHSGTTVYDSRELILEGEDWQRRTLTLQPHTTDRDATLRVRFSGKRLCLGAVSLLPADHFHGMRREVVELLKQMGVTILRWPGGNFAGEYSWMDGLLPVDMRAPFESCLGIETQPYSMGYDYHEIGTDEFIALCRAVGAQPFITINPAWNTPEENAAWVEYCNGSADTPCGRIRAERGHPEPYGVKLWSLGNEFGYGHMEGDNTPGGYCRLARANGEKMLAADSTITLCSSGPYPSGEWAEKSAKPLADIAGLVSQHFYAHQPMYLEEACIEEEYYACVESAEQMRGLIREMRSLLDDRIQISFDEWNVWYAWYRSSNVTDGIYNALALHIFMDEADKQGIGLVCHFEAVNEGMIRVHPDGAELTAQGQIFSLMKRHAGSRLVCSQLDVVATADGEGITVTVINASLTEGKEVTFAGICLEAALYSADTVLPPSRFAVSDVREQAKEGRFIMPPHSVLLLRLRDAF